MTTFDYTGRNELAATTLKNFANDPLLAPGNVRDVLLEARSYDPAGRLASVTNARGNTLRYKWVNDAELAQLTLDPFDQAVADTIVEKNTYDAAGPGRCRSDRRSRRRPGSSLVVGCVRALRWRCGSCRSSLRWIMGAWLA